MGDTKIQWTDKSWSPLRVRVREDALETAKAHGWKSLVQILEARKPNGELRVPVGRSGPHCEHVSAGCVNCYAETNNGRCLPANGTGLPFDRRSRDLVNPYVDEKILLWPFQWKSPQRIFVENQSDLFAEWNTDEMIDLVFAVMAMCPRHTFQCLTKRPERMLDYMTRWTDGRVQKVFLAACNHLKSSPGTAAAAVKVWPLPNVWLAISCEDQKTADERSAILRQVPAALRFISQEPQLAPIDWKPGSLDGISWLIQGGESGPGARPFDVAWARSTRDQCKAFGVAFFLKQYGARPLQSLPGDFRAQPLFPPLKDRKGGLMEEWSPDLRIREFPA